MTRRDQRTILALTALRTGSAYELAEALKQFPNGDLLEAVFKAGFERGHLVAQLPQVGEVKQGTSLQKQINDMSDFFIPGLEGHA